MLVTNVVTIDGREVRFPSIPEPEGRPEQKVPKEKPLDALRPLVLVGASLGDDFHLMIP